MRQRTKKKNGKYDFNKLFQEFKDKELKDTGKNPKSFWQKLKNLAIRLYSPSINGVVEGTPKFLYFLRLILVGGLVSSTLIGVIISIVITNESFGNIGYRKEVRQMERCFEQEIEKSEAELKELKDEDKIKEMTKYIKILKDGLEKMKRY